MIAKILKIFIPTNNLKNIFSSIEGFSSSLGTPHLRFLFAVAKILKIFILPKLLESFFRSLFFFFA